MLIHNEEKNQNHVESDIKRDQDNRLNHKMKKKSLTKSSSPRGFITK